MAPAAPSPRPFPSAPHSDEPGIKYAHLNKMLDKHVEKDNVASIYRVHHQELDFDYKTSVSGGTFRDCEREQAFHRWRVGLYQTAAKGISVIGAVFTALYAVRDYREYKDDPDIRMAMIVNRIATALASFILFIAITIHIKKNPYSDAAIYKVLETALFGIHIPVARYIATEYDYTGLTLVQVGLFLLGYIKIHLMFSMSVACVVSLTVVLLWAMPEQASSIIGGLLLTLAIIYLLVRGYFRIDKNARKNYLAIQLLIAEEIALAKEQEKTDHLLLNILPAFVISRMKMQHQVISEAYRATTVLFADLVGFTVLSQHVSPPNLVKLLNRLFTDFDDLCAIYGLMKIKTIGDCFMCVGGIPDENPEHACLVAEMALDMQYVMKALSREFKVHLDVRIGMNSGPVIAGVIGLTKYNYDIWGDAVNVASRMESSGVADHIQITETTYQLLRRKYQCAYRGEVKIRGKGKLKTWFLEGRRATESKAFTAAGQIRLPSGFLEYRDLQEVGSRLKTMREYNKKDDEGDSDSGGSHAERQVVAAARKYMKNTSYQPGTLDDDFSSDDETLPRVNDQGEIIRLGDVRQYLQQYPDRAPKQRRTTADAAYLARDLSHSVSHATIKGGTVATASTTSVSPRLAIRPSASQPIVPTILEPSHAGDSEPSLSARTRGEYNPSELSSSGLGSTHQPPTVEVLKTREEGYREKESCGVLSDLLSGNQRDEKLLALVSEYVHNKDNHRVLTNLGASSASTTTTTTTPAPALPTGTSQNTTTGTRPPTSVRSSRSRSRARLYDSMMSEQSLDDTTEAQPADTNPKPKMVMNKRTLAFIDSTLEQGFHNEMTQQSFDKRYTFLITAISILLVHAVVDMIVDPSGLMRPWFYARFFIGVPVLALPTVATRFEFVRLHYRFRGSVMILLLVLLETMVVMRGTNGEDHQDLWYLLPMKIICLQTLATYYHQLWLRSMLVVQTSIVLISAFVTVGLYSEVLHLGPAVLPVVGIEAMTIIALYLREYKARMSFLLLKIAESRKGLAEAEREKSSQLLNNILPSKVAEFIKFGPRHPGDETCLAEYFPQATVMFADIVEFTKMAAASSAAEVVSLLNDLFSEIDVLCVKMELEKIKTIGDAYMVASGVPTPLPDHAHRLARLALQVMRLCQSKQGINGMPMNLRIGMETGPLVGGVIGKSRFAYDVWGDTVNTASRMESHSDPGRIQITEGVYELIKDDFVCEARGEILVKGKGPMRTFWLLGEKGGILLGVTPHTHAVTGELVGEVPNAVGLPLIQPTTGHLGPPLLLPSSVASSPLPSERSGCLSIDTDLTPGVTPVRQSRAPQTATGISSSPLQDSTVSVMDLEEPPKSAS